MPPRSTYGGRKQKRRTSLRPNQRSRDARAITPLSFVNAKVKKRRTALWRAGGTGRRRRLKIVRPQGHGGSSPSPATIIIKALAPKPKSLRVTMIPLRRRGWHHPARAIRLAGSGNSGSPDPAPDPFHD